MDYRPAVVRVRMESPTGVGVHLHAHARTRIRQPVPEQSEPRVVHRESCRTCRMRRVNGLGNQIRALPGAEPHDLTLAFAVSAPPELVERVRK